MLATVEGANVRKLCRRFGVSPTTGYKWLERFKQDGVAGLSDASRRPGSHARQLGEDIICEIVRLKKLTPAWGPKKIRAVYARCHGEVPSESTFKRVLDKAGWVTGFSAMVLKSPARNLALIVLANSEALADHHYQAGEEITHNIVACDFINAFVAAAASACAAAGGANGGPLRASTTASAEPTLYKFIVVGWSIEV